MIPIGSPVTVDVSPAPMSGRVVGYWEGKTIIARDDGRGNIATSEQFLRVGEMASIDLPEVYLALDVVRAERDAMQAVIVQQCEALAGMVPAPTEDEVTERARLQEVEDDFMRLRDRVSDVLLAWTGTRRPMRPDYIGLGGAAEIHMLVDEMEKYEMGDDE